MARAAHEHAAHLAHGVELQVGRGLEGERVHHQGVERAAAQRLQQQVGVAAGHHHAHLRMALGHAHQQGRHQHRARARTHADAQFATLGLAGEAAAVVQLLGIEHQLARTLHHLLAEGREFVAASHAVEQRQAEFVLERPDAAAERGLRQVHGLGRRAEGAGGGQRDQMPELDQGHGCKRRVR
ncbi:hypothetical protein M2165_002720 [Variovorax sp. TBS-050B]|nr:hypothetical protein [Variovorax sp. TBS-050B]